MALQSVYIYIYAKGTAKNHIYIRFIYTLNPPIKDGCMILQM